MSRWPHGYDAHMLTDGGFLPGEGLQAIHKKKFANDDLKTIIAMESISSQNDY